MYLYKSIQVIRSEMACMCNNVIIPLRFNEVDRGVYWYHLVRLSVCGQNRVRSVSSTILIGSISYLHILSSNFRRCVACNARFKFQKFEILANLRIFKICNFDFVIFWLGIQYDSMVWVIMRRRGVSSERRRSSCSSYISICNAVYDIQYIHMFVYCGAKYDLLDELPLCHYKHL